MKPMLVMVPSRERPRNVERFAQAAAATVRGMCDVVFILDEDDPLLAESTVAAGFWQVRVLPRVSLVSKLNQVAADSTDYPVLMFTGDDTVPRTPGWDRMLAAAIEDLDGTGYAYPDGLGRTDIPEHVAISSDIVRALGWFACPELNFFCVDCVWADLGGAAECLRFVPQAVLEHMHWSQGKGVKDHNLQCAIAGSDTDRAGYARWRETRMPADIATVRALRGG